ncbi:uncharacterized protein PG986_012944 [Apiospora aurea]|uniref:Peptidase S8/S53 domain-containing protein n=1 Tax=Apiospora aurea TaxID=335848 RepID=A0ABR1Q1F5_9PEZI
MLALGILLLEIETRTSIEEHREDPDLNPGDTIDMDTDYRIARRLVDLKDNQNVISEILREASRKWFSEYGRLSKILEPDGTRRDTGYKRVRIAVLDTGIDSDEYDYLEEMDMIGGYRDFVTPCVDGPKQDERGKHGTIAATPLGKMCPTAVLLLARVLETKEAREKEVQNVVDAIDWAIQEEVDIVTMAIGFSTHNNAVEAAVRRARSSGILIFSAASNQRNTSDIYCPANMDDCVFGIFAANAGNREARALNPSMAPAGGRRAHCFALFGEDLEWDEQQPLVRGSSYSTSMAAGLAALLLQFSRQRVESAGDGADRIEIEKSKRVQRD